MESRAHALAAGLFTLLFAAAAAFAVWWLSGRREATEEYLIVSTRSVTGLNTQAQVRYRGVRAGRVQEIGIDPEDSRKILILIQIAERFPITAETRAQIKQQGVTGLAYVQLEDDGSSREPLTAPPGGLARIPLQPSPMDGLTDTASQVVEQARLLIERLNKVVSEDNVARVDRALADLEQAAASLEGAAKSAPEVLAGARRALSQENVRRLEAILANLDRASADAAPLANDLRSLIASLQSTGRKLEAFGAEAGSEVVGTTLPRLNALLDELTGTSRQLSRVLRDLENAPQSLLFGRAQRPGPGEPGFAGGR